MKYITSFFFWIAVYLSVIILLIFYIPASLIIKKENFADICAKKWSITIVWLLKNICGINYKIIGSENIPNEPCIIACKHQSMWETIVFHLICKYPVYIYKKELMKVPLYGWYISKMSGVKIDREGKASALKDMIKQVKNYLHKGQNVIIFPQGTRTPPHSTVKEFPYQIGVAALYMNSHAKIVPANLNSGEFWGKGFVMKKRGTIMIEFLKPIELGLKKEEFMKALENSIAKSKLI